MKIFLLLLGIMNVSPVGYPGRIEGRCEVMHNRKWYMINSATRFYVGDRIRSHEDCRLEIVLDDETVITVLPDTEISIDTFVFNPEGRFSRLTNYVGKLLIFFRKVYMKIKGKLEVKTPTAVVGVRGTRFIVSVYSVSETEVIVLEGEVRVENIVEGLGAIFVKEGERTAIFEGMPPSLPQKFDLEKIDRFIHTSIPREYNKPDDYTLTEIYEDALMHAESSVYPVFSPPVLQTPQSGARDVFATIQGGDVGIEVIFGERE